MKSGSPSRSLFIALAAAASLQPATSLAQAPAAGTWVYDATVYLYLPTVSGSSSSPSAGSSVDIDADQILDKLQMTFMGSLNAHNGRWGWFTDVLYLNFGDSRSNTRDFTIGGAAIPAGTSANIDWDLKWTLWTVAGQYRVLSDYSGTMDLLAGARMARVKTSTRWDITGALGSLPPASRTSGSDRSETFWDGIVGARGRLTLGDQGRWSLPYYADVGAGDSSLTWQAAAGVAYRYSSWGELSLMYRHLAYELKSGRQLQDVSFSGPMIGATFSF